MLDILRLISGEKEREKRPMKARREAQLVRGENKTRAPSVFPLSSHPTQPIPSIISFQSISQTATFQM